MSPSDGDKAAWPAIFEPLQFRKLAVRNRLFRSSISGRFDNYDGSGTQTRIDWDVKFARGGIGAVISSNTPVHPRGLIVPNYAHLDTDDKVPFWTELGKRVRDAGAAYIVQLAFSGRQRDIPSVVYDTGLSSTDKADPVHGFPCERMTKQRSTRWSIPSRRPRAARARPSWTGSRSHGRNGYLITQFLSSAINDRDRRVRRLAGEPRPLPARGRARDARRDRRRLPPPVQDQRHRRRQGALPLGQGGDDARGVDPGLQVARSKPGSTGSTSRPATSSRTRATRPGKFPIADMIRPTTPALEREEHVPELPHVPHAADQQGVRLRVGAAGAQARRRGDQPGARARDQAGRRRARALRGRVPDRLRHLAGRSRTGPSTA